jgi:hypothetical protein
MQNRKMCTQTGSRLDSAVKSLQHKRTKVSTKDEEFTEQLRLCLLLGEDDVRQSYMDSYLIGCLNYL